MISLIWAQAKHGVIGRGNTIPWHLPEDQLRFRRLTVGQAVLMGRNTWESLPEHQRPLPGRRNMVLSRFQQADVETFSSLGRALAALDGMPCWVIGGAQLYETFLPVAGRVEVTEIDAVFEGDRWAPYIDRAVKNETEWMRSSTGLRYRYVSY